MRVLALISVMAIPLAAQAFEADLLPDLDAGDHLRLRCYLNPLGYQIADEGVEDACVLPFILDCITDGQDDVSCYRSEWARLAILRAKLVDLRPQDEEQPGLSEAEARLMIGMLHDDALLAQLTEICMAESPPPDAYEKCTRETAQSLDYQLRMLGEFMQAGAER